MAASLTDRLGFSREKLTELREESVQRAKALQRQTVQRGEIAVGTARDASLQGLFTAGEATLDTAAALGQKLPFAGGLAKTLRARATTLEDAKAQLARPQIADYDDLNVKQVQEALDGLDSYQLMKVRRYEAANKNRKTVLSAVDGKLEG